MSLATRLLDKKKIYDVCKLWIGGVLCFCRLCDREIGAKDWKFSRCMKLSGLPFTEGQLLMILEMLGVRGCWKQALSVVQWVYSDKDHKKFQSK
jgi:hypothetical protein